MKWRIALVAGMLAGTVMTLLLFFARVLGFDFDLEIFLGTMVGMDPGSNAWIVGFVLQLIISGSIGLIYAVGFEFLTHSASPAIGAVFSLGHMVIIGVMLGLVEIIHPAIPELLFIPGPFMIHYGFQGVLIFILVHLIFGTLVGATYQTANQSETLNRSTARE